VPNTVLVVGGKKEGLNQIKSVLRKNFPVRIADPARKINSKEQVDLILYPCDFQCSLTDCSAGFNFIHLYLDIPFAIFRFLPIDTRILLEPAFSLSFFESPRFSPGQEKVIARLRSSESYSKNLILKLHPGHIVSKVLAVQTEITENPEELFNLEKSAKTAGISPCWLSHKFREISGITLKTFILKNNLCFGLWSVTSSDKFIKTIAMDLSYKPASFSERFKKAFGVPPSAVRGYSKIPKASRRDNPQKNRTQQK